VRSHIEVKIVGSLLSQLRRNGS